MNQEDPFKQDEFLKSPALFRYGPLTLLIAGVLLSAAALWAGGWRESEGRLDLYSSTLLFTEATAVASMERVEQTLTTAQQATHHINELTRYGAALQDIVQSNNELSSSLGTVAAVSSEGALLGSSRALNETERNWLEGVAETQLLKSAKGVQFFNASTTPDGGFVLPVAYRLQAKPNALLVYFLDGKALVSPARTAMTGRPGVVRISQGPKQEELLSLRFNLEAVTALESNSALNTAVTSAEDGMAIPMDYSSKRIFAATAKNENLQVTVGIEESAILAAFRDRVTATWWIVYCTAGFVLIVVCSTSIAIRQFARKEAYLRRLATIDVLTGLPNRRSFHSLLAKAVDRSKRKEPVALFFIDLDNFKYVNDSLGHSAGDSLLKHVGDMLAKSLREGDTVCRLAGDEFTVISSNVANASAARQIGERLLVSINEVFTLNGMDLQVKASMGIALMPLHADNASDLMRFADTAMYRAKQDCKGTVVVYDSSMEEQALHQAQCVRELEKGIKDNELFLVYQPKYELATGALSGHEALVRWAHPVRGTVFPGEFIPLAESSGLIGDLGAWALRRAVRQIREWHEAGHGWHKVAVNVSALQLKDNHFVGIVKQALLENGVDGSMLHLELTESSLARDAALVQTIIGELKSTGVCFAIDDFGTGYSSLGSLQQFDIDFLKVDRSFVTAITTEAGEEICRAVISLGHALKMRIVAEGVETQEQAVALSRLGCDLVQGYLYAKPVAADKAVSLTHAAVPFEGERRLRLAS